METYFLVLSILLIFIIVFLLSFLFSKTYSSPQSPFIISFVSALSISVALFCVFLIPVDVYIVSSNLNYDGSPANPSLFKESSHIVAICFYSFYGMMLMFAFFILPFYYFWYKGENVTDKSGRTFSALRSTTVFLIALIILLVFWCST